MLSLLLDGRWAALPHFLRFLNASNYKVINRDQVCFQLHAYFADGVRLLYRDRSGQRTLVD